jgi:hypothetical protein
MNESILFTSTPGSTNAISFFLWSFVGSPSLLGQGSDATLQAFWKSDQTEKKLTASASRNYKRRCSQILRRLWSSKQTFEGRMKMFIPQNIQRYVSRLTRLSPGRSTLLSVITSASSSNVLAQTLNQCSTNGPDGAVVLSLAIDQANPATIYAGTVLMQYFGYLRRNPNDAPEATLDFKGYNFWLNKLNQFNGNYIQAEMVKAFISSSEFRRRFEQ